MWWSYSKCRFYAPHNLVFNSWLIWRFLKPSNLLTSPGVLFTQPRLSSSITAITKWSTLTQPSWTHCFHTMKSSKGHVSKRKTWLSSILIIRLWNQMLNRCKQTIFWIEKKNLANSSADISHKVLLCEGGYICYGHDSPCPGYWLGPSIAIILLKALDNIIFSANSKNCKLSKIFSGPIGHASVVHNNSDIQHFTVSTYLLFYSGNANYFFEQTSRFIQCWLQGWIIFVFTNSRISMVMDCQMLLEKFPLDNQTCKINIGSCEYGFPCNYYVILFMTLFQSPHKSKMGYQGSSHKGKITTYCPSEFFTFTYKMGFSTSVYSA